MKCKTCGGNRTKSQCNICDLLSAGYTAQSCTPQCWPKVSVGLSVHPKQAQQANERAKRHGLTGVSYDEKGRCTVSDRGARRDLLRLEGMHDSQGGYGD